jgi:hypothetical protein
VVFVVGCAVAVLDVLAATLRDMIKVLASVVAR